MSDWVKCGCGGEADLHLGETALNFDKWFIACDECGVRTPLCATREEAEEAWNTAMGAYKEFEWCTDCKEYDQEKHCCHRWTKVIRNTVEDMKNRWQWIPVSEALPNNAEHDWVLGQIRETDSGYLWIPKVVEYRESSDDWFEDSIGWLKKNPDHAFEVIAWMPLPKPYRG